MRAIAVQVDQITGVGTVIKTGDYVDCARSALTEEQFASVTTDPANADQLIVTNPAPRARPSSCILQGMQVLGHPAPAAARRRHRRRWQPAAPAGTAARRSTSQQEIVILAVTAQQAEVIRYAQLDGRTRC